ncbi:uncharacterized protein LOC110686452 [Chenopodium quinoa]|uniref:uncharacterized protein LOC110686452 n=1 Tax=Chenopodium quinoa TaxID=63459 RepID=UPI000B782B62|nr:uncharacterized protein LOC110686452 [Chenopodium quinoa]
MDFVGALPKTKAENDTIWVIVNRVTKSAAFIPMRSTWTMDRLGRAYVKFVVKYHRVPTYIISDRDSRHLSNFLQSLQKAMGTKLLMSTTFHPATDGQTKRTIQALEDVSRFFEIPRDTSLEHGQMDANTCKNNEYSISRNICLRRSKVALGMLDPEQKWEVDMSELGLVQYKLRQHQHNQAKEAATPTPRSKRKQPASASKDGQSSKTRKTTASRAKSATKATKVTPKTASKQSEGEPP